MMTAPERTWKAYTYLQAVYEGRYPNAEAVIDRWFEQCEDILRDSPKLRCARYPHCGCEGDTCGEVA